MRVAVSGIPSSHMRNIVGHSVERKTLYREIVPRILTERNVRHEISRIQNTGNYLIGEGAQTALLGNYLQFVPTPWLHGAEGPQWVDYINTSFDFFVFCTANFFHTRYNPENELRLFEQLKIPVLMMSAGIQQRAQFAETAPAAFLPFIDLLKRRNIHVFTRGEPTAEFLRHQGVKYVEPVGCPSLFAFPDNIRASLARLKEVDARADLDILHSGYLGSVKDSVRDANAFADAKGRASYVIQDEPLLFDFNFDAQPDAPIYNEATGKISVPAKFPGVEELKKPLEQHVFFSTGSWRAAAGGYDFALARRFHGGLIAAQAGQPAYWISVDDRTAEMLEFAGLPHVHSKEWNAAPEKRAFLAARLKEYNAQESLAKYNQRVERFRALLKELGLRNQSELRSN
jgi:hypothetical protein